MRIIGGRWRGRRLAAVARGIRPTSDRLREALFNVLADRTAGSVWLDGYAGTGAVGLEALSRGAKHVFFNESAAQARRLLVRNIELCGAGSGEYTLLSRDVFKTLAAAAGPPVDILFFDPPYDFRQYSRLLSSIVASGLWSRESLVIVEYFKKTRIDPGPSGLRAVRSLGAGDSCLLFLTAAGDPEEQAQEQAGQ